MWLSRCFGSASTIRRRGLNRLLLKLPLRARRRVQYVIAHQRWLRLDAPRRWSEKINWRMVHDRRELLVMACDKQASKAYAAELVTDHILRIPRTVWFGDDLAELAAVRWPEHWVLKPNHGTGAVVLGRGQPSSAGLRELMATSQRWLVEPGPERWGEWAYGRARRAVLLEEAIPHTPATGLADYKFFVAGGVTQLIQVDSTRFAWHTRRFYTPQWEPRADRCELPLGPVTARPPDLDTMLAVTETLAQGFDAVRVDLYASDGAVWFGEFTIYSGSGLSPFEPTDIDDLLGAAWQLPQLSGA